MPANLTPQYRKAERQYRQAQSASEQLAALQLMLQLIPKHKGTDHLQADLKARISQARKAAQAERSAPKGGLSYRIPRQGAGQIVVLGGPNAGKSRLVAELTNADPEVAAWPFTTREPLPAMMPWEDVRLQLVDTPPVTGQHIDPWLVDLVRTADAVVLCLDGSADDAPEQSADVIRQLAARRTQLASHTGFDEDDFSTVNVRTLVCVTRGDTADAGLRLELFREQLPAGPCRELPAQLVELDRPASCEALRTSLYQLLEVIRVYTRKPGTPPEYVDPWTLPAGGTVEDLAGRIHHDLAATVTSARVWGESAGDGRIVGREHSLCDRDMVELH